MSALTTWRNIKGICISSEAMVAPNSAFLVTALQARSNVEQLNLLNLPTEKNATGLSPGQHQCHVKPNIYENDDYINQALEESGGAMGPKQLAFAQMTRK